MVKIRGHRIEPAGLAELLRSHPGVRDAAVLVERQDGREPTLLAAVAGDVAPDGMTAWLAQHVPAAMVPARIIVCAVLPLTTNGKVDRQALLASAPSVAGAAPAKAADTVASSTSGEDRRLAIVCDLWRAVLQRDDVGPDDDFFALGGDSIMAIQIVGRARAAGLGLTPTQVFLAPTPRGLAQLAVAVGGNVNGAEPVSEPVPLTPVQRWFLETPLPHRSRWCLSAVFAAPFVVTAARLKAAIEAIVARHDALRMRWDVQATPPVQRIGAPAVPEVVVVELGGGDSLTAAEDRLADRLMDGLDLAAGRMFAAGAVVLSHEQRAHIVVVAHHGVFDMVSWSIVAEDLEAALTDGAAAVRPASTSWSWWSRELAKRSEHKAAELPYWQEIAGRARSSVAAIPIDHSERANCEGDVREQRLAIARERSEQLLNGLADVFGLRTHEAVLAAVGRGLARWAGSAVLLDVEGHGRHPFDPAIDLSRTVGWFTTRYPIVLSAVASEDPAGWLVETKEMMRRVPDGGMGYGILRYGGRAALAVEPDVSFNFVGELGQFGGRALRFVRAGAGVERAADAARRNLITFDVWLEDGCLNLSCRFAARHDETTVAALMRLIDEEVNRLTAACTASASAVYSPSDFSGMDFSQDELDQLAEQVGGLTKAR
jgi:non-ribosomal peptide synthase protein (TIGR01720 family)